MKNQYEKITRHIPDLEDHGHLYMYFGQPYTDECDLYGDEDSGYPLVISRQCDALLSAIAGSFNDAFPYQDIFGFRGISLDDIFGLKVEELDFEVVGALFRYLLSTGIHEGKLMIAFQNGFMLDLVKRLKVLEEKGAARPGEIRGPLEWSHQGLTALRLHLELGRDWLHDHEKVMLKRYGESMTGETLCRDILIPSDMPLHNLHYAIQKLFGWQNSHLRRFYLPDDIYENLTGHTVKGWSELVGICFQPPSEAEEDVFWDDDYEDGNHSRWLKKKYSGPYRYGGIFEDPDMARQDVDAFITRFPKLAVMEPFDEYYERTKGDDKNERKVLRYAPVIDLTLDEMNEAISMDHGTESLMERLKVADVLALEGEELPGKGHFPLTHQLLYDYDYGDGWEITITRYAHCDDLILDRKVTRDEVREAVIRVLETHRPVCLHQEGLSVMDDVGGLGGFARFLSELYEGEDRKERTELRQWAKSMGWNPAKKSIKDLL